MNKLEFNPRNLSPFERWVFNTLRDIQDRIKALEERIPSARDWPKPPDPDRD